ncbi:hypothetical protein [Chryseobacterium lathyri]|nr:hypothetical protein [Chryseobacterium lathyri]
MKQSLLIILSFSASSQFAQNRNTDSSSATPLNRFTEAIVDL